MITDPATGDDREPFDEQEYLRLLDRAEQAHVADERLSAIDERRLVHLGRKLASEVIRLRMCAGLWASRVTLLEQGQQLFPLTTTDNQPTQTHA